MAMDRMDSMDMLKTKIIWRKKEKMKKYSIVYFIKYILFFRSDLKTTYIIIPSYPSPYTNIKSAKQQQNNNNKTTT